MSISSEFPHGYTCGGCGDFVGWNVPHNCPGRSVATALVRPSADERIAAALERIAAALEGSG